MYGFSALVAASTLAMAPPPFPIATTAVRMERGLMTWTAGTVRCEGGAVSPLGAMVRPMNALAWSGNGSGGGGGPARIDFEIDASGRPVSIREAISGNQDLGPALAATRFPAAARSGCSVSYTPRMVPIASAELADLVSYTLEPVSGALPAEGWSRIALLSGSTGDCMTSPRPQALSRAFPDFRKIPSTPGVKDWALVAYDLDGEGKPIHARVALGTGNGTLESEAVAAVERSRFTEGARQACRYPYWRTAGDVPAPVMPPAMPTSTSCPTKRAWAVPPAMRFPAGYERRRIEGWAIVGYDIAPWGAVGNVKVLQAQPSDAFGRQAVQMLQGGSAAPLARGATGCIARVKFVMTAPAAGAEARAGEDTDTPF